MQADRCDDAGEGLPQARSKSLFRAQTGELGLNVRVFGPALGIEPGARVAVPIPSAADATANVAKRRFWKIKGDARRAAMLLTDPVAISRAVGNLSHVIIK
jgi:hypothetical protein